MKYWFGLLLIVLLTIGTSCSRIPEPYPCSELPVEGISKVIGPEVLIAEDITSSISDFEEGMLCALTNKTEEWLLIVYINEKNAAEYHEGMKQTLIRDGAKVMFPENLEGWGEEAYVSTLIGGDRLELIGVLQSGYHFEILPGPADEWYTLRKLTEIAEILVNDTKSKS